MVNRKNLKFKLFDCKFFDCCKLNNDNFSNCNNKYGIVERGGMRETFKVKIYFT